MSQAPDNLLKHKALTDDFLKMSTSSLSAFSFVSIFAWSDFFDFEFKMIEGALCIFARDANGQFLYLPPLAKSLEQSTLQAAFEHMAEGKPPRAINRIENIPEYLLSAFPSDRYNQFTKNAEYLYRKADLVALQGQAYKSQRHDCNYFERHQKGITFKAFVDEDLEACKKLYAAWAHSRAQTQKDVIYRSMLDENKQVHARLLTFWRDLGLVVRVLRVEEQIIGYTFGFEIEAETFCVYAEIADLKYTGAAAFMFRSFCADQALGPYQRINTMDDFAMPNVARAKQAYHPLEMVPSHVVSLKIHS